jgi:hypothetical protein
LTSNQKLLLLGLGVLSLFLLVGQFAVGQLMASGGDAMRVPLAKYHKHLGYLMFAVSVGYVFLSLWLVINSPTQTKRRP